MGMFDRRRGREGDMQISDNAQSLLKHIYELSDGDTGQVIRRKNLGAPLVRTRVGGQKGGRTELTADGENLLEIYNALDKDIRRYTDKRFAAHIMRLPSYYLPDPQPPGQVKTSGTNPEDKS